ncbi:uncharacterized protein LOC131943958 isoform X2 [Physella acuta]|uniref:uncharacterized protein LOC131943958 isoform X2 n=1 Tax=Physella acuta TaxID=109671 RepID=UPI0027DD5060|nr:uncharacterized protein LOC131943958 isoform X2 [Physella acuta]
MRKFGAVLAYLVLCWAHLTTGHGRLWEPPGRSSMWDRGYKTPVNYQDTQLFCGGFNHQVQLGYKCGVCGDPYDGERENEEGGKYATGIVTRSYTQGQRATFKVDLTANHKGYFEFKICPTNNPGVRTTQECLNRYTLQLADGSGTRYMIRDEDIKIHSIDVVLPRDLTCSLCVLQWRYHTGNNWGVDPDGRTCIGCGPQEEFYGCSDISILPSVGTRAVSANQGWNPLATPGVNTYQSLNPSPPSARPQPSYPSPPPSYQGQPQTYPNPSSLAETTRNTTANDSVRQKWVCLGVPGKLEYNYWCQVYCMWGYCPATYCRCIPRTKSCVGVGHFSKVPGSTDWCISNCHSGLCPADYCSCS